VNIEVWKYLNWFKQKKIKLIFIALGWLS
jgi:hypothetical protein